MYKHDPKVFGIMMMNLARDLSRRLRRMDEMACAASENPVVFLRQSTELHTVHTLD
jgi:hypothetical protein